MSDRKPRGVTPERKAQLKAGLKYMGAAALGTGLGIGAGTLGYGVFERSGLGRKVLQGQDPTRTARWAKTIGGSLGAMGGMAALHHNTGLRRQLHEEQLKNELARADQAKTGSAIRLLEKRAMRGLR